VVASGLLLLHLVAFAAYVGAGVAQLQFMKRSAAPGIDAAIRAEHERLAAGVVTKIELPAIMASIASGAGFIVIMPYVTKFGWLQAKLACVGALLVLSHLEMFNARAIVKLRAAGGDAAEKEIAARKKRHELFGGLGSIAVVILMVLVTFVRFAG
jgi:uncharacterized membrane protein